MRLRNRHEHIGRNSIIAIGVLAIALLAGCSSNSPCNPSRQYIDPMRQISSCIDALQTPQPTISLERLATAVPTAWHTLSKTAETTLKALSDPKTWNQAATTIQKNISTMPEKAQKDATKTWTTLSTAHTQMIKLDCFEFSKVETPEYRTEQCTDAADKARGAVNGLRKAGVPLPEPLSIIK